MGAKTYRTVVVLGYMYGLQRDTVAYPGDEPRPSFTTKYFGTMNKLYTSNIPMLQKAMACWEKGDSRFESP